MAATAATKPELFGGRGFNDAQIEILYDDLRDGKPSNEYAKTFLETLRLPQWEVKPEGSLIGSPILDKQTNTQPMIGPSPKPTQSPAQTQPVTRIGNLGQFKTPAKQYPEPKTDAEWKALSVGTIFRDPEDGKLYEKK
jgi:hypothetical protein